MGRHDSVKRGPTLSSGPPGATGPSLPVTAHTAGACGSLNRNEISQEILDYVARHGVADKDATADNRRRAAHRQATGPRHQATLDLHGYTERRAAAALREALADARRTGQRSLLVIHGRGLHSDPAEGGVLRRLVQQMLVNELHTFVRNSRPAAPAQGGDGATVIYLR